ncbi:MAG: hypothetical protein AAF572_18990 [Cyanobacteria bacterium P01_B01_bin.77]
MVSIHPPPSEHPWPTGHIFQSPGAHLTYRVIGPCCRLFDREQLPWPCCRLQWRGKEPSWRRIGMRFIVDLATKCHPSYCVEIIGQGYRAQPIVITLYTSQLSKEMQHWWHTKRRYLEQVTIDTTLAKSVEKASPEILR